MFFYKSLYLVRKLNIDEMSNKNNQKKYLKIIKEIEKVRSKNNKNWMSLYRLAFSKAPKESINIIKKILEKDQKVTLLAKKLLK